MDTPKDRNILVGLCLLGGFYILPGILFGGYQFSDWIQNFYHYGQMPDGRPFSQIAIEPFYFTNSIKNFSAFCQILAMGMFIICEWVLWRTFFKEIPSFWSVILVFFFIANPFWLEKMNHQWEIVIMAFATLLGVLAACVEISEKQRVFGIFFLILGIFFTYQPALAIFLNLCCFSLLAKGLSGAPFRNLILDLFRRLGLFVLAFWVYYLILVPFAKAWELPYAGLTPLHGQKMEFLIHNFSGLFEPFRMFFSDSVVRWIFGFPLFVTLLYVVGRGCRMIFRHPRDVWAWMMGIFLMCSIFLMFFLSFIPMGLSSDPTAKPALIVGIGPLLLFIFVCFYHSLQFKKIQWLRYFILFPALYMMVLPYLYSNFRKSENRIENQIFSFVRSDLKDASRVPRIRNLLFVGARPFSPESVLIVKKIPYFRLLKEPDFWSPLSKAQNRDFFEHLFPQIEQQKLFKDNFLYDLKLVGTTAVVEYKNYDSFSDKAST